MATDISKEYQSLLVKPDASQYQNQEIETIIQELSRKEGEIRYARKVEHIQTRNQTQDWQSGTSEKKAAVHLRKLGAILSAFSVVSSAGQAFAGQTSILGGVFGLAAQAFRSTSEHNRDGNQADSSLLEHEYQRISSILNDQSKLIEGDEREMDRLSAMVDRVVQAVQAMIQTISSSGG